MTTNEKPTGSQPIDPDDAPELNADWFEAADVYRGEKLVKRGRPKTGNAKQLISLRLDPDVIEAFRAKGAGWQSRVNEALRKAAGL